MSREQTVTIDRTSSELSGVTVQLTCEVGRSPYAYKKPVGEHKEVIDNPNPSPALANLRQGPKLTLATYSIVCVRTRSNQAKQPTDFTFHVMIPNQRPCLKQRAEESLRSTHISQIFLQESTGI